jgi:hypothetical protein
VSRFVTPALEVVSAAAVTAGAALVYAPAGLIVAGLFGLAFARAQV